MKRTIILGASAAGLGLLFFAAPASAQPAPERCEEVQVCGLVPFTIDNYVNLPGDTIENWSNLPGDTIENYRNLPRDTFNNYFGGGAPEESDAASTPTAKSPNKATPGTSADPNKGDDKGDNPTETDTDNDSEGGEG